MKSISGWRRRPSASIPVEMSPATTSAPWWVNVIDGCRAGRQVEHAFAGSGGDGIGDSAPPGTGESEGEDVVREVVAGSDIIEHRRDVGGLFVQLGTVHDHILSTPQPRGRIRIPDARDPRLESRRHDYHFRHFRHPLRPAAPACAVPFRRRRRSRARLPLRVGSAHDRRADARTAAHRRLLLLGP